MNKPQKAKLNFKILVFVIIIGLIISFIVLNIDGPEKIWQSLKNTNPIWLIIAVIIFCLGWATEGLILNCLFKKSISSNFNIKDTIDLTVTGKLFDNLTPMATGGQPIQIWKLYKKGVPVSQGTSILITKFIFFQLISLLMYVVIIFIDRHHLIHAKWRHLSVIGVGLLIHLVISLVLIYLIASPTFSKKIKNYFIKLLAKINLIKNADKLINKTDKEIDKFQKGTKIFFTDKILFIKITFLSILQLCFVHLMSFFVFLALGANNYNFLPSFIASNYVFLFSSFIPLPGASIGAEGGFVMFFSRIYPKNSVGLAMILWRFVSYYLVIIIGLLYIMDFKKISQKLSKIVARY